MAIEKLGTLVSKVAAEDLSDYQYHAVILKAAGFALPDSANDIPFGILQNAPNEGEEAVVAPIGCGGISKAVAGASYPGVSAQVALEYVGATDAGKIQIATASQYPIGISLDSGTAEDELISVLLAPITVQ